jgi:acetyltransferase-like isoleucine patch superfamily enzyme
MAIITRLMMAVTGVKHGKMKLKGNAFIYNQRGASIVIGKNVTVKSSFLSNLIGLYQRSVIMTRKAGARIEIGDNVGMSGVTVYARKEIVIGENTLIGANTKIMDNDFHPVEAEARNKNDEEKIACKSVYIGKNCFIGCNALLLKGTEIGDGSVVGAGAVVSGKFPPNSVIAGNPARVVKTLEAQI